MRRANRSLSPLVRRCAKAKNSKTAADFSRGVLDAGQAMELSLGPAGRQIVPVFGIGGNLLQQSPVGFDGCPVLFLLVLSPPPLDQPVRAPDALDGGVAQRQVELADPPPSTKGRQTAATLDHRLCHLRDGLARPVRSAGEFLPTTGAVLLLAAKPFPHPWDCGLQHPRRNLNALLTSIVH